MKLIALIFVVIFLLSAIPLFSQNNPNTDFQSWNGVGIQYEINKKIKINFEQEVRLKDNLSAIDNYFTQGEISADFLKYLSLTLGARQIRENDNVGKIQGYENYYRIHTDLEFKNNFNRFTYRLRTRFTHKKEFGLNALGAEPTQKLRFRSKFEYDIRKWKLDPEISMELFTNDLSEEITALDKYRLIVGSAYKLNKRNRISFFTGLEREFKAESPRTDYLLSLSYRFYIN